MSQPPERDSKSEKDSPKGTRIPILRSKFGKPEVEKLKSFLIRCLPIKNGKPKEKDAQKVEITAEERRLFIRFFTPNFIEFLCNRYGLDITQVPKDSNEVILLMSGVVTNLSEQNIKELEKNMDENHPTKARKALMNFLFRRMWGFETILPDLEEIRKRGVLFKEAHLKKLRDDPKLKGNKNKLQAIEKAFDTDFLKENENRLRLGLSADDYAWYIDALGKDVKVDFKKTDAGILAKEEVQRMGDDNTIYNAKRAFQAEYLSKMLAFSGAYHDAALVRDHLIIPIPNFTGSLELYQSETIYDEKGLAYHILSIVPPKLDESSPEIIVTFSGTRYYHIPGLLRDTDHVGRRPTPGRTILIEQSASLPILEKINQIIDRFPGSITPTVMVCGHSLGAADAQNLVVDLVHVNALKRLSEMDPKNKALNAIKEKLEATPVVKERLKDTQARIKNHEKNLDKLSRAKVDLQVWGAAGIEANDNISSCHLMNHLNMSDAVNMQFAYVKGDSFATVANRLGTLGAAKQQANTENDFRPPGNKFHRNKLMFANVPESDHNSLVAPVLYNTAKAQQKEREEKMKKEEGEKEKTDKAAVYRVPPKKEVPAIKVPQVVQRSYQNTYDPHKKTLKGKMDLEPEPSTALLTHYKVTKKKKGLEIKTKAEHAWSDITETSTKVSVDKVAMEKTQADKYHIEKSVTRSTKVTPEPPSSPDVSKTNPKNL